MKLYESVPTTCLIVRFAFRVVDDEVRFLLPLKSRSCSAAPASSYDEIGGIKTYS